MSIEAIRADLAAYETRDSSNYYGRFVRLQATALNNLSLLLDVAEAAKAVQEWIPGLALGSDRPGPDWARLRKALDALEAAP
jgi:hypothetical protein